MDKVYLEMLLLMLYDNAVKLAAEARSSIKDGEREVVMVFKGKGKEPEFGAAAHPELYEQRAGEFKAVRSIINHAESIGALLEVIQANAK